MGLPGHRGGARPNRALQPPDLVEGSPPSRGSCPCGPFPAGAKEGPGDFRGLETGRSVWRVVAGATEGPTGPRPLHPGTQQLFLVGWKD